MTLLLLASLAHASSESEACFAEITTALSADDLAGRGVGTPGLAKAADLIQGWMQGYGLKAPKAGWRQEFPVVTGVTLGAGNTLDDLHVQEDFVPVGFSSSGAFAGEVVFAGYGISAPQLGYDDYAGLDVKGKIVLAMRYEPGEDDPKSPFDGNKPSHFSDLRFKAIRARELGATALVLVSPARQADEPDKLPPLKVVGPTSFAGLPVVQVTRAVADRWLASGGTTLADLRATIDGSYKPASRALGVKVSGRTDLVVNEATAQNVVGVLPGKGSLKDEYVVIGAHYDHLGMGGRGSMRPDVEAIHNGADDNASGVAGVICAAAKLAGEKGKAPRRTLVVMAFAAEEIGLGGSGWYVQHPEFPIEATTAMVNLDMVGRLRDNKLAVLGTDSSPQWAELLPPLAAPLGLTLAMGGDGYGPSDQTSFYEHDIPVVHLFTGSHEQYHTPDDDVATLNMDGGGRVATFVDGLVGALLVRDERIAFVKSQGGSPMVGDSRGYGAYFGSVPDYTAMEATSGGVKLSDTRAGSPAARAGLQRGDVIVGMAGVEVQNLYDMTFVLRDHRPGETIEVVWLRDGQRMTAHTTLETRKEGGGGSAPKPAHADFSVGAEPAVAGAAWSPRAGKAVPELQRADEPHLKNLRRLTFGGENAEAYWSPDGHELILQRTPGGGTCDQEYVLDLDTGAFTLLSSGKGRTTCGYFGWPDGGHAFYATTEGAGESCPAPPDQSQGYVWALYPEYDIVRDDLAGHRTPLLASPGYDAEGTACFRDGRIVFTSTRDGDIELYSANADGSGVRRLTSTPGYDGGAYFTPDCKQIVWRASRPTGAALDDYRALLAKGLVRPGSLEIMIMDADGKNPRALTANGAANFGPYPMPQGVIYASNVGADPREFDLWLVPYAGGAAQRITTAPGFDGFPMLSPDGRFLVFASNRANAAGGHDTDLYVAEWAP